MKKAWDMVAWKAVRRGPTVRLRLAIRPECVPLAMVGRGVLPILIAGVVASCASLVPQRNLPRADAPSIDSASLAARSGYRLAALKANGQTDDTLVIVAMSGGGKRSAAFSYGVLKGLRAITVDIDRRRRSLLSLVDVISSVSGGSFTAAYYGLHRDKIFETYEQDFLKRDIEAYIYGTFLLPWNWGWMVSPVWGTNDRMAEVYDRLMFRKATYGDLKKRGLPMIVLNATEISYGMPFSFTQASFDMICSDLGRYSLARAVAASNGFPVVFGPITLKSYIRDCPNMRKALSSAARRGGLSRTAILQQMRSRYLDPRRTRYLHLMDGGIVDNLALRGLLNALIAIRVDSKADRRTQTAALLGVRRIFVLLADGQAINDGRKARRRTVSGLGQIFDAVMGAQIDQFNLETLLLAKREFEELAGLLRRERCRRGPYIRGRRCDDVETYLVRVSLADVADLRRRERLQRIPTGLTIKSADIDALVAAGREAVLQSEVVRRFANSLE